MVVSKEKIEISTVHAKLALFATLITVFLSIIGLGIYIGNAQSVDAQQTKDISINTAAIKEIKDKIADFPTKQDVRNNYEDMKGLLQTYLSQIKNK